MALAEVRQALPGQGPDGQAQPVPHGIFPQRRSRTGRALEGTLLHLTETLDHAQYAEEIAWRPGLLQSLDPRLKLVATLLLLLAAGLSHNLTVILALYLLGLALAWRSAVPLPAFIKRVWLFVLLFSGIIALPGLFITAGPPLLRLPLGLTVTRTGLLAGAFLVLRSGTSVSLAGLLVLTTPWNDVLKALGALRVPPVFVVLLGMTYRYIFLLIRVAGDMLLSRQSRIVGQMATADERRLMAASAGVLLSRSLQLSGDVYLAMQSRGLRGLPRTMQTFRMGRRDWICAVAVLVVFALAVWFGR
jgi:cobalt/nickel transport system permease protein